MHKLLTLTLFSVILLAIGTTVASADVKKGQKLFSKKLKKACGMSGARLSAKHSQDEWELIHKKGEIITEIKKMCPTIKESSLKESYIPHYYDFFYEYANDSGNTPSCKSN